ncbi:hypothetical protein FN846DRAFT_777704 [Sphaerosporella brunnea]|uniref:Uncharacterized protein n=1 Tax=Sphaerosporella brunnea TaxID=1250544 RepID=A0A5J5EYD8_9PEZI|nr:hypothetical protein FN846DRAFT_777704 [Sphaerosporella brunnea]
MSGATDATQPPALPPINTTSTYTASASPDTPPDDTLASWPRRIVAPPHRSDDNISPLASPESILPPMLLPSLSPRSPAVETESFFASPHQSPRAPGVPSFARMGSLPETPTEVVNSPLYPPTISPLTSPSLASSPSQASLRSAHKKVPSIDPATPLAPRMPAAPLTTVTANSLADMIEEMRGELEAYDATLARMIGGGWSSPQEIRNVELQREETQRSWQQRISESKEILEGIRRREVKRSAMSSVSSFDSCGSSSAAGSSVQPTLSHVTSATSLSGSERSVPT